MEVPAMFAMPKLTPRTAFPWRQVDLVELPGDTKNRLIGHYALRPTSEVGACLSRGTPKWRMSSTSSSNQLGPRRLDRSAIRRPDEAISAWL
jgi:hypothetical protein